MYSFSFPLVWIAGGPICTCQGVWQSRINSTSQLCPHQLSGKQLLRPEQGAHVLGWGGGGWYTQVAGRGSQDRPFLIYQQQVSHVMSWHSPSCFALLYHTGPWGKFYEQVRQGWWQERKQSKHWMTRKCVYRNFFLSLKKICTRICIMALFEMVTDWK